MVEGLTVLMRWLHLASVACLSGGLIYGWIVAGAAAPLDPEARAKLGERMAAAYILVLRLLHLVAGCGDAVNGWVLLCDRNPTASDEQRSIAYQLFASGLLATVRC